MPYEDATMTKQERKSFAVIAQLVWFLIVSAGRCIINTGLSTDTVDRTARAAERVKTQVHTILEDLEEV